MTTPHERSRALVWAGGFLIELARDERLPLEIRQHAVMIARHFPTIEQLRHLAATTASSPFPFGIELEEPEANPEWREACRHGPVTLATRLRWTNDSGE